MKYEVIVYSSDSCSYCLKLKKWLTENNIPYQYKDISNQQIYNEFEEFKVNGIPFIRLIDNNNVEKRIVGFQPKDIKQFLGL